MSSLLFSIIYALRVFRRNPLFTAIAVFSLALGIGANTAVFTLLDQLVLRLLPVKNPEQLVMIWSSGPHMGNNQGRRAASYPMYQDFQKKAVAFESVFCRYRAPLSLSFEGSTERIDAELVSGNYFQALRVGPALGRVFSPEDDRVYKGHPVVVLSHYYWVNRFGGDPKIVGKKIRMNDYPMEVIGVSAAGFLGLDPSSSPHIRVPIQMKPLMTPGQDGLGARRSQWIQMFARMKPGYTVESAKASLQPLFQQVITEEAKASDLAKISPYDRNRFLKRQVQLETAAGGYSDLRQQYSTALIVLMCMAGLILLIACSNVANLLIARAAARQKEIAVRLSVGAERKTLIGQLLVESVMLSLAGAALGLLLAFATTRLLLGMLPPMGMGSVMLHATPDWRVLLFSMTIAFVTGVLFGLAPALQATRLDLFTTLKDVVGAVAGGSSSARLRKTLVTAQVALSFLLLAGAGLFARTLGNLKNSNAGFQHIENLVTFQVDPAKNGYTLPRLRTFYTKVLQDIRATPGVTSASYALQAVLHGGEWDSSMSVERHQAKDGEDMQAYMNFISPGYWQTMGVPMLEGRDFTDHDRSASDKPQSFADSEPGVAIVNRKFAEHFFGKESPLGRHIGFGGAPDTKLNISIVGVSEDSLYEGPREGVHRQVFIPYLQTRFTFSVSFYVRTNMDSKAMFQTLRRIVGNADPSVPMFEMKTLENQLDETLSTERMIASLSIAFGVLATIMAALGLYGVMAFMVARRTKEIGLRMALGAQQSSVLWLVLREVLMLLGMGLAVGIPCAYLVSRYVSTQLFGVTPTDLVTCFAAIAILTVIAVISGFIPARRASAIDPLTALRYE